MQLTLDFGELIHLIGAIGWLLAIILTIFLLYKKDASWTARIYAVGSFLTFGVMRFPYGYFYIFLEVLNIDWTSPLAFVGLIGGYALMVIALLQYRSDRTSTHS